MEEAMHDLSGSVVVEEPGPFRFSEPWASICDALISAQAEFPPIDTSANNAFFGSKYAPLGEIIKAVKPGLAKHGLGFIHAMEALAGSRRRITMRLLHRSGEWIETSVVMTPTRLSKRRGDEAEDSPGMAAVPTPQAEGAVWTYGKRYLVKALLGLESSDEDDDGNVASGNAPGGTAHREERTSTAGRKAAEAKSAERKADPPQHISAEQRQALEAKIEETGASLADVCKFFAVENLGQLMTMHYPIALAKLEARARKQQEERKEKDEPGADG